MFCEIQNFTFRVCHKAHPNTNFNTNKNTMPKRTASDRSPSKRTKSSTSSRKRSSTSAVSSVSKRTKTSKASSKRKPSLKSKLKKRTRNIGWQWQLVGDRWIRQAKPGYFDVRSISREFLTSLPPDVIEGQGGCYYHPGVFYPGENERDLLAGLAEIGYELLPQKKEPGL